MGHTKVQEMRWLAEVARLGELCFGTRDLDIFLASIFRVERLVQAGGGHVTSRHLRSASSGSDTTPFLRSKCGQTLLRHFDTLTLLSVNMD